jgi:hypothetical protein
MFLRAQREIALPDGRYEVSVCVGDVPYRSCDRNEPTTQVSLTVLAAVAVSSNHP